MGGEGENRRGKRNKRVEVRQEGEREGWRDGWW